MKIISALCLSLGIILIVTAFIYPRMVRTDSLWSENQAKERTQVGTAMHALSCNDPTHRHAHNDPRTDELSSRYEKIQAEMIEARERPQRIATILQWMGIGATVLGVGVYYAARGSE